jgi:hypothetical protein
MKKGFGEGARFDWLCRIAKWREIKIAQTPPVNSRPQAIPLTIEYLQLTVPGSRDGTLRRLSWKSSECR